MASVLIYATGSARQKSRDNKRITDIRQIQVALDAYYSNNNSYPTAITVGQPLRDANNIYMTAVPANPHPDTDGSCASGNDYTYAASACTGYTLSFCLGSTVQNATAGNCTAIPGNICVIPACGGSYTVAYYGVNYGTAWVDINSNCQVDSGECWFKDSLITSKKPDGSDLTHGIAGDYVYPPLSDGTNAEETNLAYVSQLGYLYKWASAMNGLTSENAQGLCPTGWHIPKDTEWYNLENFLKTAGQTCVNASASWECIGAELALKEIGTNGTTKIPFDSLNTGVTNSSNLTIRGAGAYSAGWWDRGVAAYLWSSTQSGINAYSRHIGRGGSGILRFANVKTDFYSIRCVKD